MAATTVSFLPRNTVVLDDGPDVQRLCSFSISEKDGEVVLGRGDFTGVNDKTVSRTAGYVCAGLEAEAYQGSPSPGLLARGARLALAHALSTAQNICSS
jgi:hypothetical protein